MTSHSNEVDAIKADMVTLFDKPNNEMSVNRAFALLWALRTVGLDVRMIGIQASKPEGESLARKIRAITPKLASIHNPTVPNPK
jgi:hypothetical protein